MQLILFCAQIAGKEINSLFSGILHSSDYHLRNKKTFAATVCLTCFLQALVARCVVRVQD